MLSQRQIKASNQRRSKSAQDAAVMLLPPKCVAFTWQLVRRYLPQLEALLLLPSCITPFFLKKSSGCFFQSAGKMSFRTLVIPNICLSVRTPVIQNMSAKNVWIFRRHYNLELAFTTSTLDLPEGRAKAGVAGQFASLKDFSVQNSFSVFFIEQEVCSLFAGRS